MFFLSRRIIHPLASSRRAFCGPYAWRAAQKETLAQRQQSSSHEDVVFEDLKKQSELLWLQWESEKKQALAETQTRLDQLKQLQKEGASCDPHEEQRLEMQVRKLQTELNDKDVNLESFTLYRAHQVENVKMPFFEHMSNEAFQKHRGPALMMRMAKYYQLYSDVFPDCASPSNFEKLLNMVVAYKPLSEPPPIMENEAYKCYLQERQTSLVGRGNVLDPQYTHEKPSVQVTLDPTTADGTRYHFMLVDADTPDPQRKTMVAAPLWSVVNIPAKDGGLQWDQGETLFDYVPPHPQKGTGFHRYVWLLLEEPHTQEVRNRSWWLERWQNANWDAKTLFNSLLDKNEQGEDWKWIPKALCFHRSAWTSRVSDLYAQGAVQLPSSLAQSMAWLPPSFLRKKVDVEAEAIDSQNQDKVANNGPRVEQYQRITVRHEPVFGSVAERSWKSIVQQLDKHAFQ